jgi:hypothetical protein
LDVRMLIKAASENQMQQETGGSQKAAEKH